MRGKGKAMQVAADDFSGTFAPRRRDPPMRNTLKIAVQPAQHAANERVNRTCFHANPLAQLHFRKQN
jgi:hypothetical protein